MKNIIGFLLDRPNYSIKQLLFSDAAILQTLYEQCNDFALLTYGTPFSASAAAEEFSDIPVGNSKEDIHLFGLFDPHDNLIGEIVAVRHYPDDRTWWIATMMLAPIHRGKGLGTAFYRAFEGWLAARGIQQISLCAIKANQKGLQFWQKMGFKIIRQTEAKQYGIKSHKVYVLSLTAIRLAPSLRIAKPK